MGSSQAKSDGPDALPEVSVVVPLFNEEENLAELHRRLSAVLTELGCSYELIFVDDGSRDGTSQALRALQQRDRRLTVVYLSRNFGHQAALTAGIEQARGRAVILMDGDLQDPPEVLGQFLARWHQGYEVVYAIRQKRKEGLFKRTAYFLFYRLLHVLSDLDIPLDSGDFCLMDRKVVEALKRLPERQRFVRGLRTFVGFRQTGLAYERAARSAGRPKYTFRALFRLAVDGLISFSGYPLSLVTYLGLTSAAVALALTIWVITAAFTSQETPRGWASTIIVVLFMSAAQLLSLGIIGEYVRRIFLETKGRPTYVVREVLTSAAQPNTLPSEKRVA
jgi:glycosyltransferase involved in cell wall biosynthesis